MLQSRALKQSILAFTAFLIGIAPEPGKGYTNRGSIRAGKVESLLGGIY